ncbi:MAG: T9SS type A sorting domain-containing protein [candidate division WOR-3 bacterium]
MLTSTLAVLLGIVPNTAGYAPEYHGGSGVNLPQVHEYNVPYVPATAPTIDGIINAGEWDPAAPLYIGDVYGSDGYPNDSADCIFYALHDESYLYMAWDCPKDVNISDHSQPSPCVEDNNNGVYEANGSEGLNGIGTSNGWYTAMVYPDFTWSGWYPSGNSMFAFSNSTGHVVMECAMPLVNHGSDNMPDRLGVSGTWPDTTGAHLYWYDQSEPGNIIAYWPWDVALWYDPATWGDLILLPAGAVNEMPKLVASVTAPSVAKGGFSVSMSLPTEADVELAIYDAGGRLISVMAEGKLTAGSYSYSARVSESGVYVLRAKIGDREFSQKVTVIR